MIAKPRVTQAYIPVSEPVARKKHVFPNSLVKTCFEYFGGQHIAALAA